MFQILMFAFWVIPQFVWIFGGALILLIIASKRYKKRIDSVSKQLVKLFFDIAIWLTIINPIVIGNMASRIDPQGAPWAIVLYSPLIWLMLFILFPLRYYINKEWK